MRPEPLQINRTLPELPRGCDELEATADPQSDTRLGAHLDCLPGLGQNHADRLATRADADLSPRPGNDREEPNEAVLVLEDLLRTRSEGSYTLHPHVQHIVQVGAIDSLLETVVERLGLRKKFVAYQYPHLLLECRGSAPDSIALHPPEYHIATIETLRELRANEFLTTVCRPGEPIPSHDTIRAAIDSTQRGVRPRAVFTLLMDEGGPVPSPVLVFHDDNFPDRQPDREALFRHVEYLRSQYGVNIELCTLSEYGLEVRND